MVNGRTCVNIISHVHNNLKIVRDRGQVNCRKIDLAGQFFTFDLKGERQKGQKRQTKKEEKRRSARRENKMVNGRTCKVRQKETRPKRTKKDKKDIK
jgi:hypothetical protein